MIAQGRAEDKSLDLVVDLPRPEAAFALPLWDEDDPARQAIEARLPTDHLARQIDAGVDRLDLSGLFASFSGRGSQPLRPDLLLKVALYEIGCGKPSPSAWFRDVRETDPLKWLARGIQPSRSTCYDFFTRAAPFLDAWNQQLLHAVCEQGLLSAERGAQDGTAIAANASRHRLVKQETLVRRTEALDAAIAADQQSQPCDPPRWMARHPHTRLPQRTRYQRANEQMRQLQVENEQRRAYRRQDPQKIVVSTSDPDAVCSRDKLRVFRPLYNVQLLRDLDAPFITAYQVYQRNHDSGRLTPLVERCLELTGRKPHTMLVDAGYVSNFDLAACELLGITVYGPVGENDFSEANGREPQTNGKTNIPKRLFRWLPEEHVYLCPQDKRLELVQQGSMKRRGERRLRTKVFRCARETCAACPLRPRCTPTSKTGRTITRTEHEELVEALRARMATPEGKALYKLRGQTIELPFADAKEHRGLRRFCRRGLPMAQALIGAFVLGHNLCAWHKLENQPSPATPASRIMQKMRC